MESVLKPDPSMNATEYKKYHESFMENNHGSTAVHTFFCIFFTVQCSIYCSIGSKKTQSVQYMFEYLIIVIPLVAAHTVLSDCIYILNLFISIGLVYEFTLIYPRLEIIKTFSQPNIYVTKHIHLISSLRALTYMITVYSILAVDFKAFPRYLAKTEQFGFSFMDTGVGLFVLMSGLVHKNLDKNNFKVILKSNFKFVSVLVTLGIVRFITVKQLDYQEHVSEYGVHWNFFFTLAVCKVFATLILFISNQPFFFSIVTVVLHEFILYNGLQNWVFSDIPRSNFVTANREGISSTLGYVSLYLLAVYVKKELNNNSVCRSKVFAKLVVGQILWLILFLVNFNRPISRTLANAAYCTYLAAILVTITTIMYIYEVLFADKEKKFFFEVPFTLAAINTNGLIYFLSSNLLTGLVNLTVKTLFVSTTTTFIILVIFMIINIEFAIFLKRKGIKI